MTDSEPPARVRWLSTLTTRPEIAIGLVCGGAALALQGPDAAVLWCVIGYFLGKSVQSTRRALVGVQTS